MKQFVIALFVFILNSCNSTEPDIVFITNNSDRILFTRQIPEKSMYQIYSVKSDGSDLRKITDDEFSYAEARWSPYGTKIAGITDENSNSAGSHIFVMNSDGTGKRLLPHGEGVSWSPDGTKIAYSKTRYGELYVRDTYIYLYDLAEDKEIQLTDSIGVSDVGAVWALNGKELYFGSNRRDDISKAYRNIYKINIATKEIEQLTFFNKTILGITGISPSGEKLVLSISGDLAILTIKSGEIEYLTTDRTSRGYPYFSARWSPDGQKMVFYSDYIIKDGSHNYEILIMDIQEHTISSLLDNKYSFYPDWCW